MARYSTSVASVGAGGIHGECQYHHDHSALLAAPLSEIESVLRRKDEELGQLELTVAGLEQEKLALELRLQEAKTSLRELEGSMENASTVLPRCYAPPFCDLLSGKRGGGGVTTRTCAFASQLSPPPPLPRIRVLCSAVEDENSFDRHAVAKHSR